MGLTGSGPQVSGRSSEVCATTANGRRWPTEPHAVPISMTVIAAQRTVGFAGRTTEKGRVP